MTNAQATEMVVRKSVRVPLALHEAFRLYTERMGTWWPLRMYSVGQERSVDVVMERAVGGRLYERLSDGSESVWGRIVVWDPPRSVVHTWHPARDQGTAQEVELTFTSDGDGTRLDLEHRGWEKLGDEAAAKMGGYDEGWNNVLALFRDAAEPLPR